MAADFGGEGMKAVAELVDQDSKSGEGESVVLVLAVFVDDGAQFGVTHPGPGKDRELVTSIVAPFGRWEPAQPSEAAAIFSAMPCPWWIAGGYAIELMPAVTGDAVSSASVLVTARWQAIDPLLPAPGAPPGCSRPGSP